jgi:cytochrome c553
MLSTKMGANKSAANTPNAQNLSAQMLQNLSAHMFCSSPKLWDFDEKRLHWESVVREYNH